MGGGRWEAYGLNAANVFGALDVDDFGTKLFSSGRSGGGCGI